MVGILVYPSKEAQSYGQELLEFMGLADKMNVNVETLSGGAKRRVGHC